MTSSFSGSGPTTPLRTSKNVEIEVVEIDEDHVKGIYKNALFMVWARQTLAPAYRRAFSLVERLRSRHPQDVIVFQVVEDTAIPPEPDAKQTMAEFLKVEGIKQFSVVFEANGFKAAAVRAIVHAGQAMARPRFPHSVHQSVPASAAWNAALAHEHSAAELQEAVQLLREHHRAAYPG